MAEATSFANVIAKAKAILGTASFGLADLHGDDPARRMAGLHNVAVFGRGVTFVLQNLRTIDEKRFDTWYLPRQDLMRSDPLLKYFHDLRNEIEKEGPPATTVGTSIDYLNTAEIATIPRPPGATDFFIGDNLGGTGWSIPMPDGTDQKYYIKPPPHWGVKTWFHLPNPPTAHLGQALSDVSAENLCALYIGYLTELVTAAEHHFATEPQDSPAPRPARRKRRRPTSGRSRPT